MASIESHSRLLKLKQANEIIIAIKLDFCLYLSLIFWFIVDFRYRRKKKKVSAGPPAVETRIW